jgi:hypothetical protein
MGYLRIKNNDDLLRDKNTNSIININDDSYNAYIRQYVKKINENNKMKNYDAELKELKDEIDEIKNMLIQLLNK